MESQPPAVRRVFILGRDAALDIEETARRVASERAQLVLLSFGYPISPTQDAIVRAAVDLADELRLWLDAVARALDERTSPARRRRRGCDDRCVRRRTEAGTDLTGARADRDGSHSDRSNTRKEPRHHAYERSPQE